MPRLIDADKMLEWLSKQHIGFTEKFENQLKAKIDVGDFDPVPPVPEIKPGDMVNVVRELQFPFLQNVRVKHVEIHSCGRYAKLEYEGQLYTIPCERLEVIADE